jgi:hypothetical protein
MDIFGDLREWGRVLEQLEQLKENGRLDDHQDGLMRLLRYRFNWRLREKAVDSLSALSTPEDRILFIVLDIVADEHTDFDLRTRAADSLCGLISLRQKSDSWPADLGVTVAGRLAEVQRVRQPPLLEKAVKRALECVTSALCERATA